MNLDFSDIKVLLIGDFMLDHYIDGISNRMSPEAPVPVIKPIREYFAAGGAGNVALNLCALGAKVDCLGQIGNDKCGKKLVSILNKNGANTDKIELNKDHSTTVKERIFLDGKQLIRIDRERLNEQFTHVGRYAHIDLDQYDACIFSDYNKGTIRPSYFDVPAKVVPAKSRIFVDPKKSNFSVFAGADFITPNFNELKNVSIIHDLEDNQESIIAACRKIIDAYDIGAVVAKRGEKGMIVVERNDDTHIIPAHKVETVDVTGAGDTVISSFALHFSKNRNVADAAKFANAAAAIIVQKGGTQTTSIEQIRNLLSK